MCKTFSISLPATDWCASETQREVGFRSTPTVSAIASVLASGSIVRSWRFWRFFCSAAGKRQVNSRRAPSGYGERVWGRTLTVSYPLWFPTIAVPGFASWRVNRAAEKLDGRISSGLQRVSWRMGRGVTRQPLVLSLSAPHSGHRPTPGEFDHSRGQRPVRSPHHSGEPQTDQDQDRDQGRDQGRDRWLKAGLTKTPDCSDWKRRCWPLAKR